MEKFLAACSGWNACYKRNKDSFILDSKRLLEKAGYDVTVPGMF